MCGSCLNTGLSSPGRKNINLGREEVLNRAASLISSADGDDACAPELMRERSTRSFVISATVKSPGLRKTTTGVSLSTCLYCSVRNCLRTGSSRSLALRGPLPLAPDDELDVGMDGRVEADRAKIATDGVEGWTPVTPSPETALRPAKTCFPAQMLVEQLARPDTVKVSGVSMSFLGAFERVR